MFAIIRVAGKQYRVENGAQLVVDRVAGEPGAAIEDVEVLMVSDGENVSVGAPVVEGAKVSATVVRHMKSKKIRVFKYKAKKNYSRRYGSRSHQTLLRVESISA